MNIVHLIDLLKLMYVYTVESPESTGSKGRTFIYCAETLYVLQACSPSYVILYPFASNESENNLFASLKKVKCTSFGGFCFIFS